MGNTAKLYTCLSTSDPKPLPIDWKNNTIILESSAFIYFFQNTSGALSLQKNLLTVPVLFPANIKYIFILLFKTKYIILTFW